MRIAYGDLETFSEVDLKTAGTHRYAADKSTEIIVWQWALGDGEPVVEDLAGRKRPSAESLALLNDPDVVWVFHNSAFDRTVMRHVWGVELPPERILDTMVQAMAHGLPGGLDKIGAALQMEADVQKDKRGKQLIQLLCKPRPKNMTERRADKWTHPEEWDEFLSYSRQDIIAMRAIHLKLPKWNYRIGHPEHKLWCLDQRINDRGICVDLDLARGAVEAVAIEKARLKREMRGATNDLVSGPSKRDDLLFYILAEYGVDLPDMRADTLRRRLEDPELPEGVKLLISLRLESTKTSTAKYQAVLNSASADGRVRNTTQFSGAPRTNRWAGRILQPHNMPRPDVDHMAEHFACSTKELEADDEALIREYERQGVLSVKGGYATDIFTDVMALTSNLVRGVIIAPHNKKLTVADLSNIEGRGLAYLGGEEWKLRAFRDFDKGIGPDLYKLAYARAFNVDPKDATGYKRQIGKVMDLGLGYEGGVAAFITFAAAYKMDLNQLADAVHSTASKDVLAAAYGMHEWATRKKRTLGLERNVYVACEALKAMWRTAHPATKQLWADASEAVKLAIANPKEAFPVGAHIKVQVDGSWLRVRLPSGRYLCYLSPRVDESGQISYLGVNQYTRQWARIKSYGGKFCIAEGSLVLARRGWTKIENITTYDKVWDGVEWVSTDGAVCNGEKEVVEAYGAWMTHDHDVLTEQGWKHASQSERYNRAACRLPDSRGVPQQRWEKVAVDGALRLRPTGADAGHRAGEAAQARDHRVVRLHAQGNHRREEHDARHEQTPSVRRVALDAGSLRAAVTSGLGQLRWAWHRGMRAVARVVSKLLAGHGADLRDRADAGAQTEQPGVLTKQLLLGDVHRAGEQHSPQLDGGRADRSAAGQAARREAFDDVLPTGARRATGQIGRGARPVTKVYDLMNCGPRSRFVIAAGDGPLIVHNCENWDQAWARDVLAHGMQPAEDEGYEIVLHVHDELVTETPDDPAFSAERLAEIMATPPAWSHDAPLAAAGFETPRYHK